MSKLPLSMQIMVILLVTVILGGLTTTIYNKIYERGYKASEIIAERNLKLISDANRKAISIAEGVLRDKIKSMIVEQRENEDAQRELDRQADEDVNADKCGVSVDSVRRLNSIRKGSN